MSTSHAPHAAYHPETPQGQWGHGQQTHMQPSPYAGMQPPQASPPYPYAQPTAQPQVPPAAPSQPYWPQPPQQAGLPVAPSPQAWQQPQPQGFVHPQQVHAPAYPPQPYPYSQQASAPNVAVPDSVIRSLSESIDEIRATVRECRDAMRALADKHARRFF